MEPGQSNSDSASNHVTGLEQWRSPADETPTKSWHPPPPPTVNDEATTPQATSGTVTPGQLFGALGPYDLIEEIPGGGMGLIFKARHRKAGHVVVLKTLKLSSEGSGEHIARFEREIKAAAQLNHRHIIHINEIGLDVSRPYYTMPLLPGGSLARNIARFSREPRRVVLLLEKIARAIHYAHEHDTWHRDLKPGNILLDSDDEPIVTDFGLAKVQEGNSELTRTGAVLGTPSYMAPEQCEGRTKDIGRPTDIWALGVILYELLTGRRPFIGETNGEVAEQILRNEPIEPRCLNHAIDPRLQTIVLTCLKKNPKDRYPSAERLANDLSAWLRGEEISVRPDTQIARAWRKIKGYRRIAAIVLGIGTLACMVCGLFIYLLPRQEQFAKQCHVNLRILRDQPGAGVQRQELATADLPLIEPAISMPKMVKPSGEPLDLFLGGHPAHARWISHAGGIDSTMVDGRIEGAIQGWDYCALELLAGPKAQRYRFSADLTCVHGSETQPEAGIFFGATSSEGRHALWSVVINDATLELGKATWHHVDVDVANEAFHVWLDHRSILDAKPAFIRRQLQMFRNSLPDPVDKSLVAAFDPHGALGLYIAQGEAAFKNVSFTPLY